MKLVIFAGGIGSRLWPLSRVNSPKQFDQTFSGKSTLQLAIDRIKKSFIIDDIFIQTVSTYEDIIREQIPDLPQENIIIEPCRRNLGPAVCLAALELAKKNYSGSIAILWADHLMTDPEEFINALKIAEELIKENSERFIFLGEKPRFANNNLGWIKTKEELGQKHGHGIFSFGGWKYKPTSKECNKLLESKSAFWNPGYFITSIEFLLEQYKSLAPDIYAQVVNGNYELAKATHFDRAIIEKIDTQKAVIIATDMGWSDPGTLYALKEALSNSTEENVVQGNVSLLNTSDSLIYNFDKDKIIAVVGLKGIVLVNTVDALVAVAKEEVVNITKLLKQLKEEGQDKYL